MTFSEYCKAVYGSTKQKNLTGISSQEWFVIAVSFHAGCTKYADAEKPKSGTYDTERDIFKGKTNPTTDFKNSFPIPIERESLAAFFEKRIGDAALARIMRNFGINEKRPPNKKRFCDALSLQFEHIIGDPANNADNIVKRKYEELIQHDRAAKFMSQKEHDDIMMDLENLRVATKPLKKLLETLGRYDFAVDSFPVFVISRLDEAAAIVSPLRFDNIKLSNAKMDYLEKQATFCKYLLRVTEVIIDNEGKETDFRRIKRFRIAPKKDAMNYENVKNKVHNLIESLYRAIDKVIQIEKELMEKVMPSP